MNIRIVLIDDHAVVRAGLSLFFKASIGVEIVGEAENAEALFALLKTVEVDLVLLDLDMPGENGTTLIRHLKKIYPELKLLVLSMHNEVGIVSHAIQAGASGYIGKDCLPTALLDAIKKTMATGRYLTPEMAELLAYASIPADVVDFHAILSSREQEIFALLVKGDSNDAVAKILSISDRTVSAHKTNILHKLGLKNIVELVNYAVENRLLIELMN